MTNSIDMSKYRGMFISEANEHLQMMNRSLVSLEKDPANKELINALFRSAHSIKGMAASMGFNIITDVSHNMENFMGLFRDNDRQISPKEVDLLFEAFDALDLLLKEVEHDTQPEVDLPALISKFTSVDKDTISSHETDNIFKTKPEKTDHLAIEDTELSSYFVENMAVQTSPSRTVRVNTELLDNLINIVGEMIIARSSLFQIGDEIKSTHLKEGITLMSNLIRDLHDQVMLVRMTPLETVMNRLIRVVRDISRKSGKEVSFNIEGKTIELDRSIVDEMADPLIHIVRNCLDHGIETPEERKKAGKNPVGNLLIKACREKGNVIINIKDDGRGINSEKIKSIAIKKRIIKKDRADLMTNREALMLVCNAGLSTAETITEVSGRGVGMDAVKKVIDSLSGRLEIDSTLGKGTSITIKLPITVAIVRVLLIKICGNIFAIPINQIIRTTEVPINELKRSKKKLSVLLDDELIALLSLKKILGIKKDTPRSPYVSIVIVEIKNKKVGLVVDCLYGQQEAFIKPLDQPLKWIRGLSGATIMGDGSVVFVLDTVNLI